MASKMREFDDYSHNLATRIEALMKIFEIMPRNMPAGSVIQLQLEDGNQLEVSKKQLLMMRKDLTCEVNRDLPRLFRKARKRKRQAEPSSFAGAYRPVVVSKALVEFVKKVGLGRVDPKDPTSDKIEDHLSCARQGYGLRNTFQLIWFLAIYHNEMQNPEDKTTLKPNKAMSEIFGSKDYPARYINGKTRDGKFFTTKNEKGFSTFEVLEYRAKELEEDKTFDRNCFKIYSFPAILSLNIYKPEDLTDEVRATLDSDNLKQRLLKEYQILQTAKENWKAYTEAKRREEDLSSSSSSSEDGDLDLSTTDDTLSPNPEILST